MPDLIAIEVDGRRLEARKGAMLIEVTDAAEIYIPRFCYHKKLTIAANCRMCLVEVEKAAKPLPACATPVMDGMRVYTRSPRAREAQRATMEFLLINHPLDCPICDQGGECELQDLALGYGADVSRYSERKRVVKDKDIGPLIQTDLTRCIHCTRCVRFGDEIAGLRELGATGRGEHMTIGTYIEEAVGSEMSGNVIDLCPVGALTSKPFRYTARAWELRQREAIAPHDSIGSNLYLHVTGNRVRRVVPRENEALNEVWISDRDRYSYLGLASPDRITTPAIREDGRWREVDWETALDFVGGRLQRIAAAHGGGVIGALVSPGATLEEHHLLQKLVRGLGSHNIDHRLRQSDFSDQGAAPLFPWLGGSIAGLEGLRAALLIGANPRKDQPIANHRLRRAALRGAAVMVLNPLDFDFNFPIADRLIVAPSRMPAALAGIAKAVLEVQGRSADAALARLVDGVQADATERAIAERLCGDEALLLLGNLAAEHPRSSLLRGLAGAICELSGARLGYLPEAANSAGAWLAGALPHRGPMGDRLAEAGLDARGMIEARLRAYLLYGLEPELDCRDPAAALAALREAECVVSLTSYRSERMAGYAHALLPIAQYAETSGTYVNAAGDWQSFEAAVAPPGEARPGWKVLRVVANRLGLAGFEYLASTEVSEELRRMAGEIEPDNRGCWALSGELEPAPPERGLELIHTLPMHRLDPLVRRAPALQQTADAGDRALHIGATLAAELGLAEGDPARLCQNGTELVLPIAVDGRLPEGCVLVYAGFEATGELLGGAGPVSLARA